MKKLLYTICLLLTGWQLQAQINTIKDIYPGTNGSQPAGFTNYKSYTYFAATSPVYGRELWKTDGTTAGTFLVKDVYQGVLSSNPKDLFVANNILYFTANDGTHGNELWMTDGTNTRLAKDFVIGSGSSNAKVVANYTGKVLVNYNTATENKTETLDGAAIISVITGTIEDEIEPSHFYKASNGLLYYAGANNSNDVELYSWNGSNTPQLVANINASGSSIPEYFLQWNDTLYYGADDGVHGREFWGTNVNTGVTRLLADYYIGAGDGNPVPVTIFKNKLVWSVENETINTRTYAGFHLLYDFLPRDTFSYNHTYTPQQPIEYNGKLYYPGYNNLAGTELYSWDGTNPPTLALDYNLGTASSNPSNLFVYKDHLFFNATDATGNTNLVMYNGNNWGNVKDSTSIANYSSSNSDYYEVDYTDYLSNWQNYKAVIGKKIDSSNNAEPATFSKIRTKHCCYVVVAINTDSKIINYAGNTDSLSIQTAWDYNNGNTFTAQLSDKNGSFANPVNIATLNSKAGANVGFTYPANTPQGIHYRTRVVATNPADTSLPSDEEYTILPAGKQITCCPINPTIDSIYGNYAITYSYWQIDSLGQAVSGFAPITVNDTIRVAPDATNAEMMTIKSLNQTTGIFEITQPKYYLDRTSLTIGKKLPAINNNNIYSGHLRPSPTIGLPYIPPYQITPIIDNPFGFGFSTINIPNLMSGPIQFPQRGNLIVEPKRNIGTYAGNRYELQVRGSNRVR